MIEVNKLNGTSVFVNPDLIRFLESAGDTVIVFTDGTKLLVRQKPQEIVARIVEYRRVCALVPPVKSAEAAGL